MLDPGRVRMHLSMGWFINMEIRKWKLLPLADSFHKLISFSKKISKCMVTTNKVCCNTS